MRAILAACWASAASRATRNAAPPLAMKARRFIQSPEPSAFAASCRRRVLAEHLHDLPPPLDSAQLDLAARYEAEEQDQCRVFARQGALRLHTAAKFFVEPFNRVRGAQSLPLRFREAEEREQLVAAFAQARDHAGSAFGPRALEGHVGPAGRVSIGCVDDAVEVVADLSERGKVCALDGERRVAKDDHGISPLLCRRRQRPGELALS